MLLSRIHSFLPLCLIAMASLESAFAAKDVPIQGRVFAGVGSADPKNLNTELEAQGLKTVSSVYQLGAEATYSVLPVLELGVRYTKRYIERDEDPGSLFTDYSAELSQESVALVGRIPVLKTKILRLDGFAGVGGTNTTLKIKTATQEGELSKKDNQNWFAGYYTTVGGSVAIGYKYLFLIVEGGMETNKVSNLNRTGTVNTNVSEIDLSGSFFTLGLLFNGVELTKK
jgi:hypothetical protein